MVGPFIFVDQFGPAQLAPGEGMDVRPHPHINLATVTYLFDGAIEHRDSASAARQVIEPGAINLMTAGKRHRPFASARRPMRAPRGRASTACRPGSRCPTAGGDRPGVRACAGQRACRWSRATGVSGAGADGHPVGRDRGDDLPFADHLCRHRARRRGERADRRRGRRARGHAGRGRGELDGQPLEPFALYVLGPATPRRCAVTTAARAMLLGGGAFATPRHVCGISSSSSRDRIEQAKEDWIARPLPADPRRRGGIHPLPGVPKTVSYP